MNSEQSRVGAKYFGSSNFHENLLFRVLDKVNKRKY